MHDAFLRASAVAAAAWATAVEPARRPTIVILYADDMAVEDVAAANADSKTPTPHLDRLFFKRRIDELPAIDIHRL